MGKFHFMRTSPFMVPARARFAVENSSSKSKILSFKKGDLSTYHYQISRTSKDSPWKLEKAWRTDQNSPTLKNILPLPANE
jgi:hypothetical protein